MNPNQPMQNSAEEPKPVAYDAEGRPLYAAPVQLVNDPQSVASDQPTATSQKIVENKSHVTNSPEQHGHNFDPQLRTQYANEPKIVHATRPVDVEPLEISDEVKRLHDESAKAFPDLNLSAGEFVLTKLQRHPIGLWLPMGTTIMTIAILATALMAYPMIAADPVTGEVPGLLPLTVVLMSLIILVGIGGYVAVWVYLRNTFYLTNESVIQEIQHSLFSKHEQTVSLGSIEDVSFRQNGILPSMFNYGLIRLSTEGEETTYKFQYVSNPKKQIAILNNAVESFKNGRPVTVDSQDDDN